MNDLCDCPPGDYYTFLHRVVEEDLVELEKGLVERQHALLAWRENVEEVLSAANEARSSSNNSGSSGSSSTTNGGYTRGFPSLQSPDSSMSDYLGDIKKAMVSRANDGRPRLSLSVLQGLMKTGKELGVSRKELMVLEKEVERVSEMGARVMARLRGRRASSKGMEQEEMSLRSLLKLMLENLIGPYSLDKEVDMMFYLLKELTDLRRQVSGLN